ncbi:MAG: hypothetical protein ACR2QF_00870, partial [Geminicoccaceae bacterium]
MQIDPSCDRFRLEVVFRRPVGLEMVMGIFAANKDRAILIVLGLPHMGRNELCIEADPPIVT